MFELHSSTSIYPTARTEAVVLHQSKSENSAFLLQSKSVPNDSNGHGHSTLLTEEESQTSGGSNLLER